MYRLHFIKHKAVEVFNTLKKLRYLFYYWFLTNGCYVLWQILFILMIRLAFCQNPHYIYASDMLPEDRRIIRLQKWLSTNHVVTEDTTHVHLVTFEPFLEVDDWIIGPFLFVCLILPYNKV